LRKFLITFTATAISVLTLPALAELGSDNPTDAQLLAERLTEAGSSGSGIFDVQVPGSGQTYKPAERVKRHKFGVVGPFMLSTGLKLSDLDNLVYPGTTAADKAKLLEGMVFFTMFHTPGEGGVPNANGVGPLNNQPACIGCHLNAAEAVKSKGLLQGQGCATAGGSCTNVSNVTQAARSTLTNLEFTSLNTATGGGNAPDHLDPLFNTGADRYRARQHRLLRSLGRARPHLQQWKHAASADGAAVRRLRAARAATRPRLCHQAAAADRLRCGAERQE